MITTKREASEIVNEALRHLKRYCHYESKERFVQILMDSIRDYLIEYAEENHVEDPVQFIKEALEQSLYRLQHPIELHEVFKIRTTDLDLSVRALNCLKSAEVETLGDLVAFNKSDLLKFRNFGRKSLTELENLVKSKNLEFGMNVSKYKLEKE
jgi:DNA-directed RNA polymerase alpha subunit